MPDMATVLTKSLRLMLVILVGSRLRLKAQAKTFE
jgi:hypothetical protein